MNLQESEYTLLPFYNPITSAKLLLVFAAAIIIVSIIRVIIFKKSLTLHRAPTSIVFSVITTSLINMLLCTFLYWQWALGVSLLISIIYAFVTEGDVKDANSDERVGVWGLNSNIRRIRGELFNDMSIEQQLEYREKAKQTRFSKILFIALTFAASLIFIFVCSRLNIGYLFSPVLIQN